MNFQVLEHVSIEMVDGVSLSARLWLPEAETSPAVLEYIPYRKDDSYRRADDYWGAKLAGNGIAFARVDVRGSGNSEGLLLDEYTDTEIADGVAIIEWLAEQSWCNGHVGMRGISWGAINTLLVAAENPPALKAIMPIAGTDDQYTDDAHFIGGLVAHTGFQWGTLFKMVMAGPPDPEVFGGGWYDTWLSRLHSAEPILANWLAQSPADWPPLDVRKIKVPTYLVAGWQDTYAVPTWRMWQHLAVPKKALFGPWGHTYPYFGGPSGLAWVTEEVAWWQRWLASSTSNAEPHEDKLRVFVPHATIREAGTKPVMGHWLISTDEIESKVSTWHLTNDGLTVEPGSLRGELIESDHLVGQCKPEWLDRAPLDQSPDDELSVTFDSKPLLSEVSILGEIDVRLGLTVSGTAASVAVRLCEVKPNGQSWLIADQVQNLSGKLSVDAETSAVLRLGATAHRFAKGSQIRVAISQSLWPLVWPLAQATTMTLRAGTITLPEATSSGVDLDLETQSFPSAPLADYAVQPHDTDGRLRLENHSGPTVDIVPSAVGQVEITRSTEEISEIVQTDPQSAVWTQTVKQRWRRDGWDCGLEAGYRLTCDEDTFHLKEWLRATFQGEEIFTQEELNNIPRRQR